MQVRRQLGDAIRGKLRYKILLLVLFPILVIMPIALVLAIYWGNSLGYQQLFIKVNTDLSVSSDIFRRIQHDYLNKINRLSESYAFRVALQANSEQSVEAQLDRLRSEGGFTYLKILDAQGRYRHQPDRAAPLSPSLLSAMNGTARVGIEIFDQQDLTAISPALAKQLHLPLLATPKARPTNRTVEDRAMMIRALLPVTDGDGQVVAVLDGGVMLNDNFAFVDAIRDLVYGKGSLIEGSIGTVTVFIDDVRITTNVPLRPGERALGTRVSNEVRSHVLDRGEVWIDRAFVVNDWYISSYEPIYDINGERVGMLYAGFLEQPFRNELREALAILVGLFIALMAFSALLAFWGAKSIFKPVEQMSTVVRAIRHGDDKRIGQVASRDEIGVLAGEFDGMLDLLQERNEQIRLAAEQLEHKVEERTAELKQRNDELHRTIAALRQTRQQLVNAEKLAALGELTAGVAHEINNPTAVILGNMDVLVDELGSAAKPVQQEIELIIEQIYRIKDIINNLLQYSRPNEYAGYLEAVDVNACIEQTLFLVHHLQKQEHFDIELDLQATTAVKINQSELQQVLVNLIVNAVHALDKPERRIAISSADWPERGAVIRVEDNGKGMGGDELSRIFNPFFSTKEQGEGTGLGLSVSYGMIRRYGGDVTAQSEPGQGTVFSLWLLSEPEFVNDEQTLSEQMYSAQHAG